jgi:hypothetical protein
MARKSFSLLLVKYFRYFLRSVSPFRGSRRQCGETFVIMQFSAATGNYSVIYFGKLIFALNTALGYISFRNSSRGIVMQRQIHVARHTGLQKKKPFM